MDFYISATLTALGLSQKIPLTFPSSEQMEFIELVLNEKDIVAALQNNLEKVQDFEQNGIRGHVSAETFFRKLRLISQRGSYRSASIRMDVQVSNRVSDNAPDCNLNMVLKTANWTKTLNIAPPTAEKLLDELKKARATIRKNKAVYRQDIQ
ncbi:unnamed protein product [Caenorhabditis sp. 36 PRJEB53466]|nr:unnamed protein product [Caenorhabditis sp. 36 PRJEB53466]